MNEISFIKGDATKPKGEGNKIIVHICNDIGGWGKGFVTALSKRWKQPEKAYREWFKSGESFGLGEVQFVQVEEGLWVANVVGQHRIRKDEEGNPPIRYEAVRRGLKAVSIKAGELNASVHMPRIGCGLAGGKWDEIEPSINQEFIAMDVPVTVYDFG